MQELLTTWGQQLQQILNDQLQSGSLSAVFVVFAAGVLTSFTPCVYPMIPVTVTYIGGAAAGNRLRACSLSAVYVGGLALIYATLGVVTALLGRQFGSFTREPWIYAGVAVLITLFGVTMLGWIEIPVPGFFGKIQSTGVRRGGHLGALLIGMAAGFVAAPCTAPVLGLLLVYVANTRDVVWGGSLLLIFALGLGLLLMILGISSGLLASLPRAGRWMDRIKTVFGAGMLVIAAWFFYQAAMIYIQS
ncbi:MAG TPA: cytochrome c biogenesis protein CcdA [Candidatus Polarisedimenticolaceae bacterium]|nr:cytochrome c biogenesis protein CcdA [Candidatus Polarisedimenticolaceae bacterium]